MKHGMRAAKVLVSACLLAILFSLVRWEEVLKIARQADPAWLFASLALSFVLVAASCWKWQILLRLQGHSVAFGPLYRWYCIGYFYSNFLPSNVGGDVARVWLAGRRIGSPSTALASVFAERFTGLVFLLLMAMILPFTDVDLGRRPALWVPAVLAFAGLLALVVLVLAWGAVARSPGMRKALRGLRRAVGADAPGRKSARWDRWAARAGELVGRVKDLFSELRTRPGAFAAVAGVTVLFYGLTVLNVLIAYRTFGVGASGPGIARVLPAALMVSMLPVTIASLGLAEGAYVYFFGLLGLGREVTLAVGLLLRVKVLLLGAVGLLAQFREPVRVRSSGTGEQEALEGP